MRGWESDTGGGASFCAAHPKRPLQGRSEDLSAGPDGEITRILTFLGGSHEERTTLGFDLVRARSEFVAPLAPR